MLYNLKRIQERKELEVSFVEDNKMFKIYTPQKNLTSKAQTVMDTFLVFAQ